MAQPFIVTQGQLSPSVPYPFTIAGKEFDLTGSTVTFSMRLIGTDDPVIDQVAAVIEDAPGGIVRYDWVAGDTDVVGGYAGWFTATLPSGKAQDAPEFDIAIDAHAPPTVSSLCDLEDVRAYLGISTRAKDELIETMIIAAGSAIANRYQREFAPAGVQTRTFDATSRYIDLAPYDLQTIATLTVDPGGDDELELDASQYQLRPRHASSGTYYALRLGRSVSLPCSEFGSAALAIAGTWGFPAIPEDVRRAAVITAASWIDRGAESYAMPNMTTDGPNPFPARPETWAIPSAAHSLLGRYERMVVA